MDIIANNIEHFEQHQNQHLENELAGFPNIQTPHEDHSEAI
jgi:hypothetical protein